VPLPLDVSLFLVSHYYSNPKGQNATAQGIINRRGASDMQGLLATQKPQGMLGL
jgi:hypothetical protein